MWWPLGELSGLPKDALIQWWNTLHSPSPSSRISHPRLTFPSFCKHPFAKPLHIQRHPVLFWHPFSLSEATSLKQLLHRAGNLLQMVGAMALPEQCLGFLETWRGVTSDLHLALLSLSEVKETCSLFCPKDVFYHCRVWGNGETWANAAVKVMVLGLCTGFGFSAWDTVQLCVIVAASSFSICSLSPFIVAL